VSQQRPAETQPWMLFAFPAAIAVPIIAGILLGGPVVGFLVAALVAIVIVGFAIRMEPQSWRRIAARAEAESGSEPVAPPADDPAQQRWRSAAIRRFLVPLVIAAVGIALVAAGSETISIIGWGTFAVAITVAISLIFLEIGYSEDRARARDERRRRGSRGRGRERRSAE
jgi:hypothetical protein